MNSSINYRMVVFAISMFIACILLPKKTSAQTIIAWDWNDGTTQGWTGSSTEANIGNKLFVTNALNGSLQIFSPDLSNVDLTGLRTISFDLSINSYSTVASPSELTVARLALLPTIAGPSIRSWNLDLSNLAFGQPRTFNLSIQNASGSDSLATTGFLGIIFADSSFTANTSSATLDNFVLSGAAVPEPGSVSTMIVGSLLFVGPMVYLRKRQGKRESSSPPAPDADSLLGQGG